MTVISTIVTGLVFGRFYLKKFFDRYGYQFRRKSGEKHFMKTDVIEKEQARAKRAFAGYSDNDIINCDESALFTNQIGNFSWRNKLPL